MLYKTLINPSFLVISLELQQAVQEGWEIDPDNLPVNNFVYYEINLIKDVDSGEQVEIVQTKKPGRPPKGDK